MSVSAKERIKVFWQPGCTSCLRTKEFLSKQGIDFESINVMESPEGMNQLRALGARSVPVVALGGRYTLCQSFDDVTQFLGLTPTVQLLPPEELVRKLDVILATAARLTGQFTGQQAGAQFRDRPRTPGETAFHVFRVTEMGLQASRQIELTFEGFDDRPPSEWTLDDITAWGARMREEVQAWWRAEPDKSLSYQVPTYYGRRTMHDVLERTTWHAAQHTRQLALMLESHGTVPDTPLSRETLAGLPVPDEVWG